MPELLYTDIQHLVLVKLCFFLFVASALVGLYKKWGAVYLTSITGLFSGIAYFFFVRGRELMFWGLNGDEITIAAMYNMVASGNLWSDFAYTMFPPFYPPGYFWLFGSIGNWLSLNGVQVAKIASLSTILLLPLGAYLLQRWLFQKRTDLPQSRAWLLASLLLFVVIDWDAIIIKPYQLVAAVGALLWTVMLLYTIHKERLTWQRLVVFAASGALLFFTYYFWFFLAAIGVGLFHLFSKERVSLKQYRDLFIVGASTILLSAPYWYPLSRSYAGGAENWQFGYLLLKWLGTDIPQLVFSTRGLVLFGGLLALVWFRKHLYMRVLLSLFVASYVWHSMGLSTILAFASPLQEAKGFFFFNRTILAFAAAYGIAAFIEYAKKKWGNVYTKHARTISIIAVLIYAPHLLFGTFVDEGLILDTMNTARAMQPEVRTVIEHLASEDTANTVTLHSGIPELHVFLPLNTFIYFNINNSHPAALFSERKAVLHELGSVSTPEAFYKRSQDNGIAPIDRMVFWNGMEDVYPIYFRVDNFPNGGKGETLTIPKELVSEQYFTKTYDEGGIVIFEPIRDAL